MEPCPDSLFVVIDTILFFRNFVQRNREREEEEKRKNFSKTFSLLTIL